jgi:hypothetical protein
MKIIINIIFIMSLIIPGISTANWYDTKTQSHYSTQSEACTAAAGWYCSTYGLGGCGYDGIVDKNSPGSVPWYRDCQIYRTTPSYGTYLSQINGYPSCGEGITPNNDYDCLVPKDCGELYNDLDLVTSGIQCTCPGGFSPITSDNWVTASCDGVPQRCGSEQFTEAVTISGITYNVCRDIEVCDPATDPNQCATDLESGCITTDPDDPCLGDDNDLVDNTIPDHCPVGYYYNKEKRVCNPITAKEQTVNESTGETTTKTTVNEGDTTTTVTNTSTSIGGNTSIQEGTGTGEENNNSASGGDTCDSAPVCSGDAIECAQLNQAWIARCEITKPTDFDTSEIDTTLGSIVDDSPLDGSTFDFSTAIDTNYFAPTTGTNICPSPFQFAVMDETYEFEYTAFCSLADTIRPLILLSGILGAIYIVFVYKRKQ